MPRKSGSVSAKNKCAPARVASGEAKWTCYSKDSLVKMAKSYNATMVAGSGNGVRKGLKRGLKRGSASGLVNNLMNNNGNSNGVAVRGGKRIIVAGKSKKQIWDQLSSRLFGQCGGNEMCWADQSFVRNMANKEISSRTEIKWAERFAHFFWLKDLF